jgi:hypothetical protein
MTITTPHNPVTDLNTEGFSPDELKRMNSLYVDIWNDKFSALDLSDAEAWDISSMLWDAIGNSCPSSSLAYDRAERIARNIA